MTRGGCGLMVVVALGCGRATPRPEQAAPAATGAVTTVVPSETDARVTQVEELLRGVPGLDVTRLPDGGYQLRIRHALTPFRRVAKLEYLFRH